jgi:hypothetical protein
MSGARPKGDKQDLASTLEALRPWSDAPAAERVLRLWAEQERGWRIPPFGEVEIADELRKIGPFATELQPGQVAAIAAFMLGNVAEGRAFDDYGAGFFDLIAGIPARTRRRYLHDAGEVVGDDRQAQGHLAAQLWLARHLHYHHELWRRMQGRQSETAARRAMQRARKRQAA